MYSYNDVLTYCNEEDVKFIRLAFCDVNGKLKNTAIMIHELKRAFEVGILFDASAIDGFCMEDSSDLLLFPDPTTLFVLPWRPSQGKVVRMFCDIKYPDGRPFEKDGRYILKQAVEKAAEMNLSCYFGAECEFYLFKKDEQGEPTKIPFDTAGYMDVAPDDKGENVRRDICGALMDVGIYPESSHHEDGPGQNEVDFRYSEAMAAADNAVTFKTVVQNTASINGLFADFSPKPLDNESGNSMHINISVKSTDGIDYRDEFMAGILEYISEMTYFLNTTEKSYARLGKMKAPKYITWSHQNRSQLIRIPAATGEYARFELRSPDPMLNPYIAYALLIYAGIEGIKNKMVLCPAVDENLFTASEETTSKLRTLPDSLQEACALAIGSSFIKKYIPQII